MTSVEDGLDKVLRGFSEIADEGGYLERVEALQALDEMRWFDNFGVTYYRHRVRIMQSLARTVGDGDVPDSVKTELEGYDDD